MVIYLEHKISFYNEVDIGKNEQWVSVIHGKNRLWAQGLPLDLQSPVSGRHIALNATVRESLEMLKLCKCQRDSHQSFGYMQILLLILRSEVESDMSVGPAFVQMGHDIPANVNVCSRNRGPLVIPTYAVGIRSLQLSLIASEMVPLELFNTRNFGNLTLYVCVKDGP